MILRGWIGFSVYRSASSILRAVFEASVDRNRSTSGARTRALTRVARPVKLAAMSPRTSTAGE